MTANAVYGLAGCGFIIYGNPLAPITQPIILDRGAGGGHRKRVRGPKPQELVNNPNMLEGRSKYDGIEELLKKQFLEPEERVIPLEEVRRVIRAAPIPINKQARPRGFTLGDNDEIRAKLDSLKAALTEIREDYSEDDAIALLLLST